jgi:hypothetical protein
VSTAGLIPVRIAPSNADGLLGQIVWIDLVGLSRDAAKAILLAGLQPGRAKPLTEPPFPGAAPRQSEASRPQPPTRPSPPLAWQPLTQQPPVSWPSDLLGSFSQSPTALLELHLLPTEPLHIELRRLDQLREELANLGRNAGLFGVGQALSIQADAIRTYAVSQRSRAEDEAGVAVTRTGQRTTWLTLPHDSMGPCSIWTTCVPD